MDPCALKANSRLRKAPAPDGRRVESNEVSACDFYSRSDLCQSLRSAFQVCQCSSEVKGGDLLFEARGFSPVSLISLPAAQSHDGPAHGTAHTAAQASGQSRQGRARHQRDRRLSQ